MTVEPSKREELSECISDLSRFYLSSTYPLPHLRQLDISLRLLDPGIDIDALKKANEEIKDRLYPTMLKLHGTAAHPTVTSISLHRFKAQVMILRRLYHEQQQLKQEQSHRKPWKRDVDVVAETDSSEITPAVEIDLWAPTPPSSPRSTNMPDYNIRMLQCEADISKARTLGIVRDDARRCFHELLGDHTAMMSNFCPPDAKRSVMLASRSRWIMVKEANALRDEAKRLAWALGLETKKA